MARKSYMISDHRQGRNPDGGKGTLIEYDTSQCPHCGGVVEIRKAKSVSLYTGGSTVFGGTLSKEDTEQEVPDMFCDRCMGMICKNAGCRRECVPFMKKLLREAARMEQEMRMNHAMHGTYVSNRRLDHGPYDYPDYGKRKEGKDKIKIVV